MFGVPPVVTAVVSLKLWAMARRITNTSVFFGEDTDAPSDNEANIYRQANSVVNWTDVVSVRIALLVRTAEESGPDLDTKTYSLAGIPFNPDDDRRQRRVFTSTIQLRNPIPAS